MASDCGPSIGDETNPTPAARFLQDEPNTPPRDSSKTNPTAPSDQAHSQDEPQLPTPRPTQLTAGPPRQDHPKLGRRLARKTKPRPGASPDVSRLFPPAPDRGSGDRSQARRLGLDPGDRPIPHPIHSP